MRLQGSCLHTLVSLIGEMGVEGRTLGPCSYCSESGGPRTWATRRGPECSGVLCRDRTSSVLVGSRGTADCVSAGVLCLTEEVVQNVSNTTLPG